jgi:hydroxymethylbilane synthase
MEFMSSRPLRIGTRGSQLARWQSDWVADRLRERGVAVEIVEITTQGDVQQRGPIASIGGQGIFTKEIQAALQTGTVDVAVHSLKDLPTAPAEGLTIAATPERENPADALIAARGASLAALPAGSRVGTGSQRRVAQLLAMRPDLAVASIRGNVDTRLRKLDEGEYDAIVLAAAGLTRLGWASRITELLAPPAMLPAPGQGALAIECRGDDRVSLAAVATLDHAATRLAVTAERAVLAALHGGCSVPVAAWGRVEQNQLHVDALVAALDGKQVLRASGSTTLAVTDAEALGRRLADELLSHGAAEVIAAAREVH